MVIKPNAGLAELSSPFFLRNEEFCREFESYIASKNGKVKGTYNAWSYLVMGEITNPKRWNLTYKKATYSSTGNLLMSSAQQSLLVLAEWSTPRICIPGSGVTIMKKSTLNYLTRLINPKFKTFNRCDAYLISGTQGNSVLVKNLFEKLESLFRAGELYSIAHKNEKLTISLRTEEHHFDIFENLLEI